MHFDVPRGAASPRMGCRPRGALAIALACVGLLQTTAHAQLNPLKNSQHSCVCNGQYWRVSSQRAPTCGPFDPGKLDYFFFDCRREQWRPSSLEEFLASDDPQVSTCVFVPGYEPDPHTNPELFSERSTNGGWLLYEGVAPRCRPFRMVIFIWPGEREKRTRLVTNMRKKLAWAELHGWYLAWLLDQMHPEVPLGLTSDSLGACVLTGALQVLGGGSVGGQGLDRVHPERRPPRVAMMASTMSNSWLAPGRRHGLALSQVDRMLITVNPRDRMLKLYRIFKIGGGGRALGATGEVGDLGVYRDRVRYVNVYPFVHGHHWYTAYLKKPEFVSIMKPYAFPPPVYTMVDEVEAVEAPSHDEAPHDEAPQPPDGEVMDRQRLDGRLWLRGLERGGKPRLDARGGVGVDDLAGSGLIELLDCHAKAGFAVLHVSRRGGVANLSHQRLQGRTGRAVACTANETLTMALLGAGGIGHVLGAAGWMDVTIGQAESSPSSRILWILSSRCETSL